MSTHKHSNNSLTAVSIALAVLLAGSVEVRAQLHFGEPENLGPVVNSAYTDLGPSISADGLSLFFASDRPGGSGDGDIWMSSRTSIGEPWAPPVNLGPTVNSSSADWDPDITADGLALFFPSRRSGGQGAVDVWLTTRNTNGSPWGTPVNLGSVVNTSYLDGQPSISADALTLFFYSNRPGGYGMNDLWMTTRPSTADPWQPALNLGPSVNSSSVDAYPDISTDELTLFFSSTRPGGFGDYDLWVTRRASLSDPWPTPVNLGALLNTSSREDGPCISFDGLTLLFSSSRPDGYGWLDLWQVDVFPCHGDLNRDGEVGLPDLAEVLAHYGDPGPWSYGDGDLDGDGDVDLSDLAELLGVYGTPCP